MSEFGRTTRALHTRIDTTEAGAVVTPLFQNSAFEATSPFFYTRKDNPNSRELEMVVQTLEDSSHCSAVTTGMTAIATVLSLVKPGSHVLLNKAVYGCTFRLFKRLEARRDVRLSVLDLSEGDALSRIPGDIDLVFFETPTNPFLYPVPIGAVAAAVKSTNADAIVVVDNTWATPLFQKPLKHGADITVYSATKYFSGHSDVMGGLICTDRQDLADEVRTERFYSGGILDPHSAWLLRRSMQTFEIRMRRHVRVTKAMGAFLSEFEEVRKVYLPVIDGDQLTDYGGILFFEFRENLVDRYDDFVSALQLFDTGTAMACVSSMVAQPFSGSHASMTEDEKASMGLGRGLVRLCFGLEDVEDLKNDISGAFGSL